MNELSRKGCRRAAGLRTYIAIVGTMIAFTGASSPAAVYIWDGGGANTNWNTAGNWTGSAPSSNDQNNLEFGSVALQAPGNTTANNTSSGFNVNTITFNGTAGASFNLTGSNIEFKKHGSTAAQPLILQNSNLTQTLNFSSAMAIGGDQLSFTGNGTGVVNLSGINTGGKPIIKDGTSSFVLTGALSSNHTLTLNAGTIGTATLSNINASSLRLRGGVLSTNGTFNRAFGSSSGQFNWGAGGGGFAAFGGALLVDAPSTSQTWGASNFVPSGAPLIFGSAIANNVVTYQDAINLGSSGANTREIRAIDNPNSSADYARITGNLTQSGGTQSLSKTGDGLLELAGAANNYAGTTTVTDGTLLVSGTLTSGGGLVSVASGATLAGTGTIHRAVSIAAGGILSPGASAGTLTLGSLTLDPASILNFELDQPNTVGGGENDLVVVNGNLTLAGVLNVTPIVDFDAFSFGLGSYRLFDYTGTLTNQGLTFGSMPSGFNYTIDTSTSGQVNLVVSAVPEPSSLALLALGALAMRRRRTLSRR